MERNGIHADKLRISGYATLNNIQGDYNSYNINQFLDDRLTSNVMHILLQHSIPGAFYDSAERGDPPRCHPKTRKAVLSTIINWFCNSHNVRLFLWLCGPAGSGNTAIAQTIAEMLAKRKLLAATFFFSRSAAGRNTKHHLIATLAYQFSLYFLGMKAELETAMQKAPSIFSRSLSTQMHVLIITPLNSALPHIDRNDALHETPALIIIDGLDECENSQNCHQEILKLLGDCAAKVTRPLRFLIASRPETNIRNAWDYTSNLHRSLLHLELDANYQPDDDIRKVLISAFESIRKNHPARGFIPPRWPSKDDIERLIIKASGQFIYVATVKKFIECNDDSPMERLNIILGISPT